MKSHSFSLATDVEFIRSELAAYLRDAQNLPEYTRLTEAGRVSMVGARRTEICWPSWQLTVAVPS